MAQMVSKYFSFNEFTATSNAALQDQNRKEAADFMDAIVATALLMDSIQDGMSLPINVHSGFRCAALNGATPGSSKKSQHMKGQACDFSPNGVSDDDLMLSFQNILAYLIENGIMFGQFIHEAADRPYGRVTWLHLSLGAPWRPIEKCGQVLTMKDGTFELLKSVPFGR